MNRAFFNIAGHSYALTGVLPEGLEDSFISRFFCPACSPEREIHTTLCPLPPLEKEAVQVYKGEWLEAYRLQDHWLLRIFCFYQERQWEYARLVFPNGNPTPAQLTVNSEMDSYNTLNLLNSMAPEHLLAWDDTALLHASYIVYHNKAIVFTAPSGTGKSTQARLWRNHRGADIINGDKCVLLVKPDGCYAAGLPYAGTSRICKNRTAALSAVVCLGQSKTNRLRRMGGAEAARRILSETIAPSWYPQDLRVITQNVLSVCATVPVWELNCLPDESAVSCLEEALRREKNHE